MCLLLLSYDYHREYKLIVAANRDEFYNRPAKPARFWENNPLLLAGRDLQAGGTWLGITKYGRFAAITNYRETQNRNDSPSRGNLVTSFLESREPAKEFSNGLMKTAEQFNRYNLVMMDSNEMCYFSNKTKRTLTLSAGIYALSNHLMDTPWPKVEKSKKSFKRIINKESVSADELFNLLSDTSIPPDELLPDTGLTLEIERAVSPIFVSTPFYGTRSSTVVMIDRKNEVIFTEKSLNVETKEWTTQSFRFFLEL